MAKGKRGLFAFALALVLLALGCIGTVTGSSNIITREMNFTNFNRIEITGIFEADISHGAGYRVSITANENLFNYIEVTQSGDTLKIGLRLWVNFLQTTQKVVITMPELYSIDLTGASKAAVGGFHSTHSLDLKLFGASAATLRDIQAGNASFQAAGASQVTGEAELADSRFDFSGASFAELKGTATNLDIVASGAGRLNLAELPARNVRVNLSGGSVANINATGQLDGDLSGGARLTYLGNPTLGQLTTSGGASISRAK